MAAGTGPFRPIPSHDRTRSYSTLPDVALSPTHLFADSIYEIEVLRLDHTSEAAHDDRLIADALDLGILEAEIPIAIRDHSFGTAWTASTPSDCSSVSAHSGLASSGSTAITSASSRTSRDHPPRITLQTRLPSAAQGTSVRQSMASIASDSQDAMQRSGTPASRFSSSSRSSRPVRRSLSLLRRGSTASKATTIEDEPPDQPFEHVDRSASRNSKGAFGRIFGIRASYSSNRTTHTKKISHSAPASGRSTPIQERSMSPYLRPMAPLHEDPTSATPVRFHSRSISTPLLHTIVISHPELHTLHNSTQGQLRRFQHFHLQQCATLRHCRTLALRSIFHSHIRGLVPMQNTHTSNLLTLEDRQLEEEVTLVEELESSTQSLEKQLRWRRDFVGSGRDVSNEERTRLQRSEREWADIDTTNRKTVNRLRMKQERSRDNMVRSQREQIGALEKRMRDQVAETLKCYRGYEQRLAELYEGRRKRVNGRWELEILMWAKLEGKEGMANLGQVSVLKWPETFDRPKRTA
ncbi:hypothetical protein P152DRAFT_476024 [Eremomyces bilateralis CBS 781.70]|uniref:Uncharacterized protein n=1 Tax=Eremomyces bilateralis CBS 781.70 TaxID=1392243 RepID=A0A6G1FW26_9PEZI|nr:uncharacterized protein P152DRAFT_476024 [Eremomyces bilateralis CBS 781.70]KAF1809890.1 hypothetical protein P152DRAFT_476024 [Eremomyces bilateralis CBS 781.70]